MVTVNNVADAHKFHGIQDYSSVDQVIFFISEFSILFKILLCKAVFKKYWFHNYFKFLQQQFVCFIAKTSYSI